MKTPRMIQLEELLKLDPSDTFTRYGLALEHASAGDNDGAIERLREMVGTTEYVPAFLMLGQMLNTTGDDEGAKATFTRGIELATSQGNQAAASEMAGFVAAIG